MICSLRQYSVLPDKLCDLLIELFDKDVQNHERIDNKGFPNFTQLNLNQYHSKIIPSLCDYFTDALKLYSKDVPTAKFLPHAKCLEEFRIKKYEIGGKDRFDEHVDITDRESARRCLSMIFYLNNVEEGGHTVFQYQEISIKPVKGDVYIFYTGWELSLIHI